MKHLIDKCKNHAFVTAFIGAYQSSEMPITSIAVAYYFLISIFPLLLVVTSILPYFHIQTETFLGTLRDILPDSLYNPVFRLTDSILNRPSTSLLSFSIVSALWTFSQTMTFLQKAFNKVYGVEQGRGLIWARIFSFIMSVGLQLVLGLSLVLAMFGRMIIRLVHDFWSFDQGIYESLLDVTQPMVYLMLFVSLVLLYFFLPNVHIKKFRYVMPGAVFVLVILYCMTNIFSAYIERYMESFLDARFLGSVLIVVVMFWFIIIAKILIFGAVLNASYQAYKVKGHFQPRNGEIKQFVKEEFKKGGKQD